MDSSTDWLSIQRHDIASRSEHHDLVPFTEEWDAGDMGCGELVMALRMRLNSLAPGTVIKVTASNGLSKTTFFTEKYTKSYRPAGTPRWGASLWGYGTLPAAGNYHDTGITPPEHNYASGLWSRVAFVNLGGASSAWDGDLTELWKCACHKKPEFGPQTNNVHPLKAQGYGQTIMVCMGDHGLHGRWCCDRAELVHFGLQLFRVSHAGPWRHRHRFPGDIVHRFPPERAQHLETEVAHARRSIHSVSV